MIRLENIEKEDLKKIVEWNINRDADYLLQWAGPLYNYPLTLEELEAYYLKSVEKENSNTFIYKIILNNTNEMIGTLEIREVDSLNKIGRAGRILIGNDNNKGLGIGTMALNTLLDIGFTELMYEKITLGVFDFNVSAIKCYEKSGFVREKLTLKAREASNGYWNLLDMGITKENWENNFKNISK